MAQAKVMKLKEYGTDILAHSEAVLETPTTKSIRFNNTFKSTALCTEEDQSMPSSQKKHPKSRDNLFRSNPLKA